MRSGKLVVLETKGDDRDNPDSAAKLKLGQVWAARAGDPFRYLMEFQAIEVEGAHPLDSAIALLAQM